MKRKIARPLGVLLSLALFGNPQVLRTSALAQGSKTDYSRANALPGEARNRVTGLAVDPIWTREGDRLYYRVQNRDGEIDLLVVDPKSGEKKPAFDRKTVASAVSRSLGVPIHPNHLPIERIDLDSEETLSLLLYLADPGTGAIARIGRTSGVSVSTDLSRGPFSLRQERPGPTLRSRDGSKPTVVFFSNTTPSPVEIFWVDGSGTRSKYATLDPGKTFRQTTYSGHAWVVVGEDEKDISAFRAGEQPGTATITGKIPSGRRPQEESPRSSSPSPRTSWTVEFRNHNAYLRHRTTAREERLTDDGTPEHRYAAPAYWSPDGRFVAFTRVRDGKPPRKVYVVESSPKDRLQPKLIDFDYRKPGDPIPAPTPVLFRVRDQRRIPISRELLPNPWSLSRFHWKKDSSRLYFVYNERGHQILRLLAVDPSDGKVSIVTEEKSETFVDYPNKTFVHHLEESDELLWMSERDGWNHLYLIDRKRNRVKRQVTHGPWVVRSVERVDEQAREVWLFAGGLAEKQDPYYLHLARVSLDGSDPLLLTEGDGTHSIRFSPDRKYFVDTWSRVDLPPIHELRRSRDGAKICELLRADWTALLETGWKPPLPFVAKGRDESTDIYGVIYRPRNFDPNGKYPVVEAIYAGPHGQHVPKSFLEFRRPQALAELGFVTVQIDGMGTNWRSKSFHDVCWKNLADAGFLDRIAWMKAAAREIPAMDLERVGIYGGSAGGQNAVRALIDHSDFYSAAAADCGCHDNRMDKVWWNELWMGYPVDERYEESSNVVGASRLEGHLLLTVGELDRNVDPASTIQLVDALIKADKDFELIVFPGGGHGAGESPYGIRRRRDFFVRHLLGVEPRWEDAPLPDGKR